MKWILDAWLVNLCVHRIRAMEINRSMGASPLTTLALMRSLRGRESARSFGFTLVELMVVAASISVLTALALPNLGAAGISTEAGARVGEAIGLARGCASYVASKGVGMQPTTAPSKNGTILCTSTGGTVVSGTWPPGTAGVRCLGDTSSQSSTRGTITISSTGSMECAFGSTE
jgi:type II secretory pathway pseudopilin PulG